MSDFIVLWHFLCRVHVIRLLPALLFFFHHIRHCGGDNTIMNNMIYGKAQFEKLPAQIWFHTKAKYIYNKQWQIILLRAKMNDLITIHSQTKLREMHLKSYEYECIWNVYHIFLYFFSLNFFFLWFFTSI